MTPIEKAVAALIKANMGEGVETDDEFGDWIRHDAAIIRRELEKAVPERKYDPCPADHSEHDEGFALGWNAHHKAIGLD